MQTIVYNSSLHVFVFYRGGYDETEKKGLDPYNREHDPLAKEKGFDPLFDHGVADGLLLHATSIYSKRAVKFFFGEDFLSGTRVVTGDWKVCFDDCGRLVFYRAECPDPVRVTKVLKTESKFYKEWTTPATHPYMDPWPREVHGWKFKKGVEYAIVDINPDYLFQLLPVEYEKLGFGKNTCVRYEDWLKRNRTLYELDPIDLNTSWDRTDEEKAIIQEQIEKIRAEKRAAAEELERRKRTPGYCSVCGCEGAEYVADPYSEEMYGTINMTWLCPDCYHDSAMDV